MRWTLLTNFKSEKNLTNPHPETVKYHSQTLDQTLTTNFKNDELKDTKQTIGIETTSKVRTYACDKCKSCDEFEPDQPKGIVCKNCKCELIHHLFDGDESPVDDDPEEWRDEDSEELEEGEEEEDDWIHRSQSCILSSISPQLYFIKGN